MDANYRLSVLKKNIGYQHLIRADTVTKRGCAAYPHGRTAARHRGEAVAPAHRPTSRHLDTSSPLAPGRGHIVAGSSTRSSRSAAASRHAAVSAPLAAQVTLPIPRQGSRQAGALFFHRPGRVTCIFIFTFSHSSSDLAIFVALVTLLCTVAA